MCYVQKQTTQVSLPNCDKPSNHVALKENTQLLMTCSPLNEVDFLPGGRTVIASGRYLTLMLQGSPSMQHTHWKHTLSEINVHQCCIQEPALQDQAERHRHGNRGVRQSLGSSLSERRWSLVAELSEEACSDVCTETIWSYYKATARSKKTNSTIFFKI